MPEYAGYQKRDTIDWSALGKEIGSAVDQGLRAREERKAADQKLFQDSSSKLNSWESTQNKSFNTVVLGGLDQARNKALQWNKDLRSGTISRSEYQKRMSNLNESFDALSTATKSFDQYVTAVNDRQQKGLSSSFEMFSALINSDLQNVGNKSLNVGDEGDFFMVSDTDGTVQNVRNYTNMNNIVDNKINVPETVDSVVSKWDPIVLQQLKARGATVLTEDPRLNNSYKQAKQSLIGSIVNEDNPRGIVSVLLDNSDLNYEMYYTTQQRNDLINKAISAQEAIDNKSMTQEEKMAFAEKYDKENLIQVVQDNDGKYQPVINDKMIQDAKNVVSDQIEAQLGWKKEEERGFAPSSGGGGRTSKDEEKPTDYTLYEKSLNAFNLPFNEEEGTTAREKARQDSAQRLSNLSGGRYIFEWGSGSNKGYLLVKEKDAKGRIKEVGKAKKYDEIVPFLFGQSEAAGSDKGFTEYKKQKQEYFQSGKSTQKKGNSGIKW